MEWVRGSFVRDFQVEAPSTSNNGIVVIIIIASLSLSVSLLQLLLLLLEYCCATMPNQRSVLCV